MTTQEKGIMLANKSLANPKLLETLPKEIYFEFIMGLAEFDIKLARKVEALRPLYFKNPDNKAFFWAAVSATFSQKS